MTNNLRCTNAFTSHKAARQARDIPFQSKVSSVAPPFPFCRSPRRTSRACGRGCRAGRGLHRGLRIVAPWRSSRGTRPGRTQTMGEEGSVPAARCGICNEELCATTSRHALEVFNNVSLLGKSVHAVASTDTNQVKRRGRVVVRLVDISFAAQQQLRALSTVRLCALVKRSGARGISHAWLNECHSRPWQSETIVRVFALRACACKSCMVHFLEIGRVQ